MRIQEGDFLEAVTKADLCVCHFYHRDFERCKVLDKHLTLLARKYADTRFIRLSAPVSPPAAGLHHLIVGTLDLCHVMQMHSVSHAPHPAQEVRRHALHPALGASGGPLCARTPCWKQQGLQVPHRGCLHLALLALLIMTSADMPAVCTIARPVLVACNNACQVTDCSLRTAGSP